MRKPYPTIDASFGLEHFAYWSVCKKHGKQLHSAATKACFHCMDEYIDTHHLSGGEKQEKIRQEAAKKEAYDRIKELEKAYSV
ncbi:hypothetical protein CI610_02554 [invertebrate metagenome]|uniref:Uncharacterized protein n=1 Tax=invertebrate metagenome TaxID=1711999 RepID=A0A2H9T5K8_9ZZZZ